MARRPPQSNPERPTLSADQKRRCIDRLAECIRDLERFDPQQVQKRRGIPEVVALEAAIDAALSAAFGNGTVDYDRYRAATKLDNGPVSVGPLYIGRGPRPDYAAQEAQNARRYLADGKAQSIALLQGAIRLLQNEIADQQLDLVEVAVPDEAASSPRTRKVFVVHGHDEGARETVARFLEKNGFEAVILHEKANRGRTVIEKIVAHGDVGFAVVILTPDDEGGLRSEAPQPRARQNVILELGYFVGRLGRENVCALKRGELEIPSDFGGVVYTPFDDAGGWKRALGQELQHAGYEIDWNIVMRT